MLVSAKLVLGPRVTEEQPLARHLGGSPSDLGSRGCIAPSPRACCQAGEFGPTRGIKGRAVAAIWASAGLNGLLIGQRKLLDIGCKKKAVPQYLDGVRSRRDKGG